VSGAALRELAGYPSAVLASRTDDDMPSLRRVHVTGPAASGRLRLFVPPDDQLRPGRVSLLAHSHDEQLWSLRSVVVTGELVEGDGWTFRPERIIGDSGTATPLAIIRRLRGLRRTAQGYLDRRALARPEIPWADLKTIKAGGTAQARGPAAGPPSSR
jgi:hypothetical protein